MAWRTPNRSDATPKAVISLMAEAAVELRDEILEEITGDDPELQVRLGIPVFDSLSPKTRIFCLADVLRCLSDPELTEPELYAWNEGTVWAIFSKCQGLLEMEIDEDDDDDSRTSDRDPTIRLRRLVRDALVSGDPSADAPSVRSRDLEDWRSAIEAISDGILWDRDFLDGEILADMDPRDSNGIKDRMRISEGYFTALPPLVREDEYRKADRFLRQIAGCAELSDPW